jgi:hypothetical protein
MRKMDVEVLVFEGCPNVEVTLARVRAAVATANVPADVRLLRVRDAGEAKRLRFLGSPTVRIEGVDIEPSAADRKDFGLQCRLYFAGGRPEGAPPTDSIISALRGEATSAAASRAPAVDCTCGEGERR